MSSSPTHSSLYFSVCFDQEATAQKYANTFLAYLRLYGVDAKQHPVFRELTRVKQYFEKIKALETEPEQRKMTLDKGAANRFVKHGLVS